MGKRVLITMGLIALFLSPAILAAESGDIIVRAGFTKAMPDNGESVIYAADQTVHLGAGLPGLTATVEDESQLGLNIEYFLNKNFAIEVLAATPFTHNLTVDTGAGRVNLGDTKHLPPVISAVYHLDTASNFKPYIGVGINYTIFFEDNFNNALEGNNSPVIDHLGSGADGSVGVAIDLADLNLKSSWGLSAQIGADYYFNDHWLVNGSVRYADIDTTAQFTAVGGAVPGKVNVAVDPVVVSLMVGYKF